jgi:hypothetical protein
MFDVRKRCAARRLLRNRHELSLVTRNARRRTVGRGSSSSTGVGSAACTLAWTFDFGATSADARIGPGQSGNAVVLEQIGHVHICGGIDAELPESDSTASRIAEMPIVDESPVRGVRPVAMRGTASVHAVESSIA